MRRVLIRAAVFTIIGAVLTVLVAAGSFLGCDNSFRPGHRCDFFSFDSGRKSVGWPWPVPRDWPDAYVPVWSARRMGYRFEHASHVKFGRRLTQPDSYESAWRSFRVRCGWPAAVVFGIEHFKDTSPHPMTQFPPLVGSIGFADPVRGVSFPVSPLWPGFAVDTAFWAGAAFVLWSVPAAVVA